MIGVNRGCIASTWPPSMASSSIFPSVMNLKSTSATAGLRPAQYGFRFSVVPCPFV